MKREPSMQNIPIQTKTGRRFREAFLTNAPSNFDFSELELSMLTRTPYQPRPAAARARRRRERRDRLYDAMRFGFLYGAPGQGPCAVVECWAFTAHASRLCRGHLRRRG